MASWFSLLSLIGLGFALVVGHPAAGAGQAPPAGVKVAHSWNSGTIYFLLIDRFQNGNPANDRALGRGKDGAMLRGFEGGDLAGVRPENRGGVLRQPGRDGDLDDALRGADPWRRGRGDR